MNTKYVPNTNLAKSKVYRIGVLREEVANLAHLIHCGFDSLPFIYPCLPVGIDMSKASSWFEVIDSFTRRLSPWKSKCLSIRGCLTLTKAVLGSLPLYYLSIFRAPLNVLSKLESIRSRFFWGIKDRRKGITWVKWGKVCSSLDSGGLCIRSIRAKNLSLIGKWKWHFLTEHNPLWRSVIKVLHGDLGGFDMTSSHGLEKGTWLRIT